MENMKTVIFCGGRGTRLHEMTGKMPKPLVPVGGRPILWHIMKIYSHFDVRDFVLCLGYKGDMIKNYFLNYRTHSNDFSISLKKNNIEVHTDGAEDWNVTLVDTGQKADTGERLQRVKDYVGNRFFVTYGDGLADIDLKALVKFHEEKGKIATLTAGHPYSKYGLVESKPDKSVVAFSQKPRMREYINIGFMVFERGIFDHLKPVPIEDVLSDLAKKEQLVMFQHDDFFHAMDTYKDYSDLNSMCGKGDAPWKVWK